MMLAGACCAALAQTPDPKVLQPLSVQSIAAALERPVGQAVPAAKTSGKIDLKGRSFYIAEYLLLFDLSGETTIGSDEAAALGRRIATQNSENVTLAWRARPDVEALQRITDRAWADLQARLQSAGVNVAAADSITFVHGAVYAATDVGTRADKPVVMEQRVGDTLRRYLAFAPTGMKLVPRGLAGIGLGNLPARVTYMAKGVESLSLAMAVNFSGLEGAPRPSPFTTPDDALTIAPLLEVVPAPAAALVNAHAQLDLINLTEPVVVEGDFARMRPSKDAAVQNPETGLDSALGALLSIGRRITGANRRDGPRIDVALDLDGPATARFALLGIASANEAIAQALKAAAQ